MEVSGVNRLLSLARELGVEPTRARGEPRVDRKATQNSEPNAPGEDGIRLSLSAAANERSDPTGMPTNALPSPPATTQSALVERTPRQRHAIAAYARNAAAATGERVRVSA